MWDLLLGKMEKVGYSDLLLLSHSDLLLSGMKGGYSDLVSLESGYLGYLLSFLSMTWLSLFVRAYSVQLIVLLRSSLLRL